MKGALAAVRETLGEHAGSSNGGAGRVAAE